MTPSLLIARVSVSFEPLTLMVVNLKVSFGASAAVAIQANVNTPANTLNASLRFFITVSSPFHWLVLDTLKFLLVPDSPLYCGPQHSHKLLIESGGPSISLRPWHFAELVGLIRTEAAIRIATAQSVANRSHAIVR
jgi:hypothetical protein